MRFFNPRSADESAHGMQICQSGVVEIRYVCEDSAHFYFLFLARRSLLLLFFYAREKGEGAFVVGRRTTVP